MLFFIFILFVCIQIKRTHLFALKNIIIGSLGGPWTSSNFSIHIRNKLQKRCSTPLSAKNCFTEKKLIYDTDLAQIEYAYLRFS